MIYKNIQRNHMICSLHCQSWQHQSYSKIVKLLSHRETHFWSVFTGRGLNKKQLIYRILVELKENLLTKWNINTLSFNNQNIKYWKSIVKRKVYWQVMLNRHLAHFFKGSWNECYVQTLTQSCNTEREEAKHTANQYNNQHSQTFQYN